MRPRRLHASTLSTVTGAAVQAYSRQAVSVGGSGVHFIGSAAGCFHQVHPSLGGLGNYSPHHVRCV